MRFSCKTKIFFFFCHFRSKSRSVDHGLSAPFVDLDSLRSKVEGRFESIDRLSSKGKIYVFLIFLYFFFWQTCFSFSLSGFCFEIFFMFTDGWDGEISRIIEINLMRASSVLLLLLFFCVILYVICWGLFVVTLELLI